MTRFTPILIAMALASCGPGIHGPRIASPDLADAGTTAVAMSSGLTETNVLAASAGPAAPVALLVLKFGAKAALIKAGVKPKAANHGVETMSALGACANIMTIAGAAPPAALLGGMICAVAYFRGNM